MTDLSLKSFAPDFAELEATIFRRRWQLWETGFWLICVASYFIFPAHLILLSQIFITGLFALSLDLIVGFTGIISLGHAMFFGVGAYTAGILAAHGWGEPLTGLLAAAALASVLGFFSALLIVRVDGIAVLMITLGLNLLLAEAANRAIDLTGGDDGLQGVSMWRVLGLFDFDIFGRVGFWYALAVLFLIFLLTRRLLRSPLGLALAGIRQNPRRMRALGTSVGRYRILIYTISAAIAGIAGGLLAQTTQFVGLDAIGFERSAEVLIMLILGGVGWLYGGLIGAAIFLTAHDQLANLNPQYWMFWLGLILVVIVLILVDDRFARLLSQFKSLFERRSPS
jgi:branched-chain amino acid transport system permease protein